MPTKIFKNQKELLRKDVIKEISSIRKWSIARTRKQIQAYNKGLKQLRQYEQRINEFNKQTGLQLLYKESLAKKRYKSEYKPTESVKLLKSIIRKPGRKSLKRKSVKARITPYYKQRTQAQFSSFIEQNKLAQEIVEKITNPVKREQALTDLANKIQAKRNEQEKIERETIIPFSSDIIGSDTTDVDFDFKDYM